MDTVVPQPPPSSNRGLWMLVIGLGIAILVVVALMIGMAVRRAFYGPPAHELASVSSSQPDAVPGAVPELALELKPGSSIVSHELSGDTLVVRITSAEADELLIIEPAKSRVISRVRFTKLPAE